MKPLVEGWSRGNHRLRDNVKRTGRWINDGSAGYADLRSDISVAAPDEGTGHARRNAGFARCATVGGINQVGVPQLNAWTGVRIEGIQAVVLGSHEDDVVLHAVYGYVGNPQRLRINRPVNCTREELAERRGIYAGSCECIFLAIDTVAGQIVVIGIHA